MNDDKDKQTAQVIINNYIASAGDTARCPHCGEVFTNEMLRDDKRVPTHDYPKPCRSVCPGAGQFPIPDETPLVDAIATALAAARRETWKQAIEVAKKERVRVAKRPPEIYAVVHDVVCALESAAGGEVGADRGGD